MNEADIAIAMQQRLVDANIAPIVGENINGNPARPFLFVEHKQTETIDLALAGGQEISRGFMAVTVVIEEGVGSDPARRLYDQIKALYPKALRIPFAGGVITVPKPCSEAVGRSDGPDYRLTFKAYYDASAV